MYHASSTIRPAAVIEPQHVDRRDDRLTERGDDEPARLICTAVLLRQVAELPEAEAEHVGGAGLHAAGALERALEVRALDVLQVAFEIEAVAGLAGSIGLVARPRRGRTALAQILGQRRRPRCAVPIRAPPRARPRFRARGRYPATGRRAARPALRARSRRSSCSSRACTSRGSVRQSAGCLRRARAAPASSRE